MGKMFAGGYWKRSYPRRTPIAVYPKAAVPEPTETIQNDVLYWIARCFEAEERAEELQRQVTAAETRIAELKLDRELIMKMRPVSRSVTFKEEF